MKETASSKDEMVAKVHLRNNDRLRASANRSAVLLLLLMSYHLHPLKLDGVDRR